MAWGLFKSIGKIAKAVVKSPITKIAAGALAIVVPPAGAAAIAGLAVANKAVDMVDAGGKAAAVGKAAIQATIKAGGPSAVAVRQVVAARQGNPQAQAAVRAQINTSYSAMRKDPNPVVQEAARKIQVTKTSKELNRVIKGYNSKDPKERAAVQKKVANLKASRDPKARRQYRRLVKRTAAIRTARKYVVDARGVVKKKADIKVGADTPNPRPMHPQLPTLRRVHCKGRPCLLVKRPPPLRARFRVGADVPPHAVTWWVELVIPHDPENAPYWRVPFRASGFNALERAAKHPTNTRNKLYRWNGSQWAKVA